jgi:hypothetical protein
LRHSKLYNTNTAFLDMLFNTLLAFVALFLVAFVMMNVRKVQETPSSQMKGEFMITAIWDEKLDNDVDTWIEDPEGQIVGFNRREAGLMHLDRDDLGFSSDTVQTQFGPVTVKENREIVTIRGITPGEFTVNVHMYRMNDKQPTKVRILLEKLNPYKIVTSKEVVLTEDGDEKTAFRFTLSPKGEVMEINQLPKKIVGKGGQDGR